uniref:Peptidase A1 domain-containing protein n=1 Tax=Alexandrium andersonii TaxID=327968 RepID=A0A7S2FPN7_9DINO
MALVRALTALLPSVALAAAQTDMSSLVQVNAQPHRSMQGRRDQPFDSPEHKPDYQPRHKAVRQEMQNYMDMQYFASIAIGGQEITGIIDTGSFELVVFETHCQNCGIAAKYNKMKSNKHRKGVIKRGLFYGSGDIYAAEAFDMVDFGPKQVNQSFWEAYEAFMPVLQQAYFQSIIGVGPPEMPPAEAWKKTLTTLKDVARTVSDGREPELWQLVKAKNDTDFAYEVSVQPTMLTNFGVEKFTVCLLSQPGSPGYFVWGDDSSEKHPEVFKRIPVLGRHTWTLRMTDVRLQPREMNARGPVHISCAGGCGAIVDSGTSLLMVPANVVSKLEEALTELDADCTNMQDLPDITFNLGDHTFSLPPDSFLAEVNSVPANMAAFARLRTISSGRCQLSVMESYSTTDWGPLWILGMPFFRKYYTTFHIGKNHDERALLVAPADSGCYPSTEPAVLSRSGSREVYRRRLDLSNMYISPLVKEAAEGVHMSL